MYFSLALSEGDEEFRLTEGFLLLRQYLVEPKQDGI